MVSRRLLALFFLLPLGVAAAELEGVTLADRVPVAGRELLLNGIGLRSRVVFKVYVAGLYLPERGATAEAVLAMPGPKRMAIAMLRDVGADSFAGSLSEGLRDNLSEAELARLKPQVDELMAAIARIGEAKKGALITIDYAPGAGCTLAVNGAVQGKPIPGEDFFRALLRVWIGEKPVSADLKRALLGQK